jgi:DNA-binding CsgD family transcriptional regulator
MPCACPIGRRPDAGDIDAALRRVGEEGAETLSAIARRLEVAKATLSRHRSTCLGLDAAPAVPPPGLGGASASGHETAGTPEEREATRITIPENKAITLAGDGRSPGTPSGTAVPARSRFAGLANPRDDAMTAPRKLVTAEVERRCLELRIAGKTYVEIGDVVGIAEETALDTVERVLRRTRNQADQLAEGARALELARVDAIIASFWARATDPNRAIGGGGGEDGDATYDPSQDKAGQVLLKAMERRAKLLGLDSANVNVRVEQLPEVQGFLRIVLAALEAEAPPDVKARVLGRIRRELAAGRGGAGSLGAPQVIEVRPETGGGGAA